ncbi:hypothetical protein P691DRAFT_679752, partial [Macrolepiota fuliginosa MF-IS2]
GFFHQAKDFTINNPTMVEVVNNMVSVGRTALEYLMPYTEPGAAMDSSARDPPPKCHPGTHLKIGRKLETWLDDLGRERNMMWLRSPAGTGKSAIAQTFAEHCYDRRRLGAAFFFSRPNNRDQPKTVIPTLAYQLAVHCHSFSAALTKQLAGDPQLITKAPHVQLRKLIIKPLLILQTHKHKHIEEPFMIIIDGLDECEGERAQFEFVSMINEAAHMINEAAQLKNLPLLWLICSRPEAHLQYTFSGVAYCDHEELLLDDESRGDVNRYLHDELARIKDEYTDIPPPSWPSKDQLDELSGSASGLFVFASTGVKYIGDPAYANPVNQLKRLLSFLKHADATGTNNPLARLDLLYTQILTDVPEEIFPTTQRVLAYLIVAARIRLPTAQVLCNFLCIDISASYSALRKLHSVIAVPAPEHAPKTPLHVHHASFQDFLSDPSRSGKFAIEEQKVSVDIVKSVLKTDYRDARFINFLAGWDFDKEHLHASLPSLKWVSTHNEKDVSRGVADLAIDCFYMFYGLSDERDEDLSSLVHGLDFRYVDPYYFPYLADWLYRQDPSDPILRTEPSNELDMRLLEYLRTVIGQGRVDPATFPWKRVSWHFCALDHGLKNTPKLHNRTGRHRAYFFIGHGDKTTIVCLTECRVRMGRHTLNLDKEPTPQQVEVYQDHLVEIRWNGMPDYEKRAETVAETAEGEDEVVSL